MKSKPGSWYPDSGELPAVTGGGEGGAETSDKKESPSPAAVKPIDGSTVTKTLSSYHSAPAVCGEFLHLRFSSPPYFNVFIVFFNDVSLRKSRSDEVCRPRVNVRYSVNVTLLFTVCDRMTISPMIYTLASSLVLAVYTPVISQNTSNTIGARGGGYIWISAMSLDE